jgi:acyl-coenzyme A synthetase/AMP-(fatty) acid ligase
MSVKQKIESIIAWAAIHQQITAVVAGIVLTALAIGAVWLVLFWAFHQTDSPQEQKADNSRVDVIEKQADANVQAPKVEQANKDVRTAEKNSEEAEKVLPAAKERVKKAEENVNRARDYHGDPDFNEANAERCRTYNNPGCNGAFESQRRP